MQYPKKEGPNQALLKDNGIHDLLQTLLSCQNGWTCCALFFRNVEEKDKKCKDKLYYCKIIG